MRQQHLGNALPMLPEGTLIGPDQMALPNGCNSLLLGDGTWQVAEFELFDASGDGPR
jgi:hypothetical protein